VSPSSEPAPVLLEDPRQQYTLRRQQRQAQLVALTQQEKVVGWSRVVVFLAGLLMAWLIYRVDLLGQVWLLLPLAIFVALLFAYDRIHRRLLRARRAVQFHDLGLARLDNSWQGKGKAGTRFLDENHPYSADLDLFGPGSLFELLCTAQTQAGEETLASWLTGQAAPIPEIRARQVAIAELRPALDLREELAVLGQDLSAGVDFGSLITWGRAPPILVPRWPRWLALVLGLCSVTTLTGWLLALFGLVDESTSFGLFFTRVEYLPFIVVLCLQLLFYAPLHGRVHRVLAGVNRRGRDLTLLAHVLGVIERASFASEPLRQLQQDLFTSTPPGTPSERVAQLGNLIDILESRRNQFFAPLALLLLWGTQVAYALERWRTSFGPVIGRWLEAVGTFEALCSLASYAFDNPADPFPELLDTGPWMQGEGLGHPLLAGCVRNDLDLAGNLRVIIVSGSNMSGKSTFLRTVGVNAVLAQAGAPVRGQRLRISPLTLGATLRIQDSLQAGRSRFYAELLRLKQLVDQTQGPLPLLFLLDELFAGTNSHDRRIGAEALIKGLVEAGAVGLLTTHDLTLTTIADELGPQAINVHFADHFEHGEMHFDYRLHPGVVQKSNALALMRAVGLNV
jgi:hypothetical protein